MASRLPVVRNAICKEMVMRMKQLRVDQQSSKRTQGVEHVGSERQCHVGGTENTIV